MKKLILALVVISSIAISCNKKQETVETQKEVTIKKTRKIYKPSNLYLPNDPVWTCPEPGGNCMHGPVVTPSALTSVLESGNATTINTYFSGTSWEQYFSTQIVNDDNFKALMTSSTVVIAKNTTSTMNVYLIGEDSNLTTQNALYILPLNL